jgi:beta-ketoacyl-acyl-carrier-protein synthase II
MGAITPLGGVHSLWESVVAGKSGIRRVQSLDADRLSIQIAGEVDFDPANYLDKRDYKRMARSSQMAQVAARFAIQDAGLTESELEAETERVGVVVGTTQGGYEVASQSNVEFAMNGRRPRPLEIVNSLPNMAVYYPSREARATGPILTVTAACASGTQSIGEAARYIRDGRADVAIAGGTEALIQDYILEGLGSMGVLARNFNDRPTEASRPFDADRDGFVYSEGSAFVVLETLEHALSRSAHIYAEVLGYGVSADNYHITAPDENGAGAIKAMKWALEDARVSPDDIDYINAHGTSTPINDRVETRAIKQVFNGYDIPPISSTKSMIGHCIGAAGSIEAIVSIMTIRDNCIHPTINYTTPDPECDLDYVPNEAREHEVNIVLSNSFGFGGQNACLVLGAMD